MDAKNWCSQAVSKCEILENVFPPEELWFYSQKKIVLEKKRKKNMRIYNHMYFSQTWLQIAKLYIGRDTAFLDFGPGSLCAPSVVAFASIAGHC